jgi:quercetin dioxygenase-like cupin family protein
MLYNYKRIHIRPEDYLARFMDWDDSGDCYVQYYVEPTGPYEANEMSDSFYDEGDSIPYHEHAKGVECFLLDAGSAECQVRGRKAVAKKGDIVLIAPYTSHGFRYLEDGTIWRELFQEIRMNEGILELDRVKEYHPETAGHPDFERKMYAREGTRFFDWQPELEEVETSEMSNIRTYESALARFDFDGVSFLQKVTRQETGGNKEVWQLRLKEGTALSWTEWNPHSLLFAIYSGSVRVSLDGEDDFVACARDILNIPTYVAGTITALEDVVMHDFNCKGFLFRALEELTARLGRGWDVPSDEKLAEEVLLRCDCFVRWKRGLGSGGRAGQEG